MFDLKKIKDVFKCFGKMGLVFPVKCILVRILTIYLQEKITVCGWGIEVFLAVCHCSPLQRATPPDQWDSFLFWGGGDLHQLLER